MKITDRIREQIHQKCLQHPKWTERNDVKIIIHVNNYKELFLALYESSGYNGEPIRFEGYPVITTREIPEAQILIVTTT